MSAFITAEEKERIRQLTLEEKSQQEIADALGWTASSSRNRVYYHQKKMGLARNWKGPRIALLTPEQEEQILALLIGGKGTAPIARELGVAQTRVRAFAEGIGIGRRLRQWDALEPAVRQKIIEEINSHHNFGLDLAAKYAGRIGYKPLLQAAHTILDCPKFRTSRAKAGPLTSDWPQKNRPRGKLST